MSDRSERRRVFGGDAPRSERASSGGRPSRTIPSECDVPTYNTWVAFYARLDRRLPGAYRPVAFGGVGLLGAGLLSLAFYARVADSLGFVEASARTLVVGFALLAFGSGYYVVRARSTCSACETTFARRRTEVRQVRRRTDDEAPDRVYLEETFECEACGDRTAEPNTYSQQTYVQF